MIHAHAGSLVNYEGGHFALLGAGIFLGAGSMLSVLAPRMVTEVAALGM